MAKLSEIRDKLDKLTELMSARVLTYNAGVFGTIWAISTTDDWKINAAFFWAASFSLISFSFDIMQFAFAYLHQRRLEHKAKISSPQEARQEDFPLLRKMRFLCFDTKLAFALASAVAFIVGAVILGVES